MIAPGRIDISTSFIVISQESALTAVSKGEKDSHLITRPVGKSVSFNRRSKSFPQCQQ
jgi:hypothetical protein